MLSRFEVLLVSVDGEETATWLGLAADQQHAEELAAHTMGKSWAIVETREAPAEQENKA